MILEKNKKIYSTYEDFEIESLLIYAGLDCIATSGVLAKTGPEIFREPEYVEYHHGKPSKVKLISIAESMESYTMPFFNFICDMEINGIKYDTERNLAIGRRMQAEAAGLEEKIFSAIGKHVDLDSGKTMREFLYDELKLEPPHYTKHNEPSTDGEAMKILAKSTGFTWLADIGKRNDITSAFRTFIETYVQEHVKRDGRIHPSYNLNGTSSFRITGDNPNLTQLPRAKHGYNIRECYTVENGNVFVTFDFSSAEVKVLGALCRDPNLLKAIREGLDFHSFSASVMHGIPYDDFVGILKDETHRLYKDYKEKRQVAKVLT